MTPVDAELYLEPSCPDESEIGWDRVRGAVGGRCRTGWFRHDGAIRRHAARSEDGPTRSRKRTRSRRRHVALRRQRTIPEYPPRLRMAAGQEYPLANSRRGRRLFFADRRQG